MGGGNSLARRSASGMAGAGWRPAGGPEENVRFNVVARNNLCSNASDIGAPVVQTALECHRRGAHHRDHEQPARRRYGHHVADGAAKRRSLKVV